MIIMFKTQSSVFLFLRESYYNISSTDIPFAEVVKSIKKSADFVFEPINDTDKVKKSDETESYSQEAFSLASYDDNELTGIGGEDILTAKEKTSFAPVSMSQKAVMPVENAKITSKFGYRVNPVTEEYGFHTGLDLAVREGTPIRATFGGTVIKHRNLSFAATMLSFLIQIMSNCLLPLQRAFCFGRGHRFGRRHHCACRHDRAGYRTASPF